MRDNWKDVKTRNGARTAVVSHGRSASGLHSQNPAARSEAAQQSSLLRAVATRRTPGKSLTHIQEGEGSTSNSRPSAHTCEQDPNDSLRVCAPGKEHVRGGPGGCAGGIQLLLAAENPGRREREHVTDHPSARGGQHSGQQQHNRRPGGGVPLPLRHLRANHREGAQRERIAQLQHRVPRPGELPAGTEALGEGFQRTPEGETQERGGEGEGEVALVADPSSGWVLWVARGEGVYVSSSGSGAGSALFFEWGGAARYWLQSGGGAREKMGAQARSSRDTSVGGWAVCVSCSHQKAGPRARRKSRIVPPGRKNERILTGKRALRDGPRAVRRRAERLPEPLSAPTGKTQVSRARLRLR